ncbi:hypothetical protein ABGB18_49210 [Nonomuraea sp. B12E4]|uniref:hypothetical protein n=1 Tax=Nonomuraea sp. B12E4 TaxID=3153564 RepID=UPI00325D3FDF
MIDRSGRRPKGFLFIVVALDVVLPILALLAIAGERLVHADGPTGPTGGVFGVGLLLIAVILVGLSVLLACVGMDDVPDSAALLFGAMAAAAMLALCWAGYLTHTKTDDWPLERRGELVTCTVERIDTETDSETFVDVRRYHVACANGMSRRLLEERASWKVGSQVPFRVDPHGRIDPRPAGEATVAATDVRNIAGLLALSIGLPLLMLVFNSRVVDSRDTDRSW